MVTPFPPPPPPPPTMATTSAHPPVDPKRCAHYPPRFFCVVCRRPVRIASTAHALVAVFRCNTCRNNTETLSMDNNTNNNNSSNVPRLIGGMPAQMYPRAYCAKCDSTTSSHWCILCGDIMCTQHGDGRRLRTCWRCKDFYQDCKHCIRQQQQQQQQQQHPHRRYPPPLLQQQQRQLPPPPPPPPPAAAVPTYLHLRIPAPPSSRVRVTDSRGVNKRGGGVVRSTIITSRYQHRATTTTTPPLPPPPPFSSPVRHEKEDGELEEEEEGGNDCDNGNNNSSSIVNDFDHHHHHHHQQQQQQQQPECSHNDDDNNNVVEVSVDICDTPSSSPPALHQDELLLFDDLDLENCHWADPFDALTNDDGSDIQAPGGGAATMTAEASLDIVKYLGCADADE
jgi:hypothetical protein